jgi:hypothetical protein
MSVIVVEAAAGVAAMRPLAEVPGVGKHLVFLFVVADWQIAAVRAPELDLAATRPADEAAKLGP